MTNTTPLRNPKKRLFDEASWFAMFLLDSLVILTSVGMAYAVRYLVVWPGWVGDFVRAVPEEFYVQWNAFLPIGILLLLLIQVQFTVRGMYRLPANAGLTAHLRIIFNSTTTAAASLVVVVFSYRPLYYSRLVIALAFAFVILLLSMVRVALVLVRRLRWSRGIGRERYLVVGGGDISHTLMTGIVARPHLGYALVGYVANRSEEELTGTTDGAQPLHFHYLGGVEKLRDLLTTYVVDQVIIALPFNEQHLLPGVVEACRKTKVDFRLVPDLLELSFDRVEIGEFDGLPLIGLREVSIRGINFLLKRASDIALTLLISPLVLAASALIAIAIKLDSSGPILFTQKRVGTNGRHFTMYKFRTMVVNAEQIKAELTEYNEADGPIFKIRHDPRHTRVGRWLRRTSLDELPQLWNILRGEMSWVGPRPATPNEVALYAPWHLRRLEAKPGLTGLWQVSGRSDTTFEEMVRLDIYYVEHWSLLMDLRIVLQTIPTVLLGRGAY